MEKNLLLSGLERRKEFSILHHQQHLFVLKGSSCESNEAYFVVLLPHFRGKG